MYNFFKLIIVILLITGCAKDKNMFNDDNATLFEAIDNKDYDSIEDMLHSGEVSPCAKKIVKLKQIPFMASQDLIDGKHKLPEYTIEEYRAFSYAIGTGDTKIVNIFLPYVDNITKPKCLLSPSLFGAIKNDDIQMIKFLVDNGSDINFVSKNSNNMTPIEFAFLTNKFKSAQYLLDNGAIINDRVGFKTLELSVNKLSPQAVKILIDKKVNLNYKNELGNTVMHIIASGKIQQNMKKLEIIINSDYFRKNNFFNKKEILENFKKQKSNQNNYLNIAKLLLQNGADITIKNKEGKTPLVLAEENKMTLLVDILKQHNTNIK